MTQSNKRSKLVLVWKGLKGHMYSILVTHTGTRAEGSSEFCTKIPFCAISASRGPFVDKQEKLNPRCVLRRRRANLTSYVACVVSG